MISAMSDQEPAGQDTRPADAARALCAPLFEQTTLGDPEQRLLRERLDRLTADAR